MFIACHEGNTIKVIEKLSSHVEKAVRRKGMLKQPTVLVVDDDLTSRELLRTILKPHYRILMATEGEQAVRIVEQESVDIVCLDLRMPGLSGMRVMEKIKALDPSIEVIVITGYTSYETVLEGLRLRAFDYISKPLSVSYLRETVKRAMAQRYGPLVTKRECASAG
jgi:DNA-binding NtrC family response regulator